MARVEVVTRDGESRLWVVWLSSALAAVLVALGVNGTLSGWTQAVVTHDGNTISTGSGAVALRVAETGGPTCDSEDSASNSTTCSVNLFSNLGSTVTNLQPGGTATTTVTITNRGDIAGATLNVAPGACTGSAALCSNLRVTMTCTGAATKVVTLATLNSFGTSDGDLTGTLDAAGVNSTVCVFLLTLPVIAPPSTRGQTVSQDVVWTLTA